MTRRPKGRYGGQSDSEPCQSFYPTSRWMPGEIVRDEIIVAIADDAPPGDYQLSIAFYLLDTMTRLPATDAAGLFFPEDAVPLGRLRVEAGSRPQAQRQFLSGAKLFMPSHWRSAGCPLLS